MSLLERINSPRDLRPLSYAQLTVLAQEIRQFLITEVSASGGHLGPNLGMVELSMALHRVFDSPRDAMVFDTGHQAYVHKILTGRKDFTNLRTSSGLSGYPARDESDHDIVENSHASTSLSWADGIARARQLDGHPGSVVTVIGDGALTGGMAWEALNNISENLERPLVIVLNDNGRSYAPTIGGVAHHLDALRTTRSYEKVLSWGKRHLDSKGVPGRLAYDALHAMKAGIKDVVIPPASGLFDALGIKYLGPIDGHDLESVETAMARAKDFGETVVVHVMTEKGRGYTPAENDVVDRFHAVGKIHPETGLPMAQARFGWTSVFAEEIVELAEGREDIVALTAAMLQPVGLLPMVERFPDRVFDVGIAEQHALTSAAGLSYAGKHPVIALYATFLNRAYDQLLLDAALHRQRMTLMLDRSGITGADGPSHNGMWDIALLSTVPGLRLAAPRDEATLREEFREAVEIDDGPTVVRYPKGSLPKPLPALERIDGIDVLHRSEERYGEVLVIGVGPMAATAVEVATELGGGGIAADAADPRWIIPTSDSLVALASEYRLIVVIEDGLRNGGVSSGLRDALADAGCASQVRSHGLARKFLNTADRGEIIAKSRMRSEDIAADTLAALSPTPTIANHPGELA